LEIDIIQQMKEDVCRANIRLKEEGLVVLTWGNVSQINRELGVIVIKPSGVPYSDMTPKDMVVTDLEGNVLDCDALNPSSDLPTHVELYKAFPDINAVVHTHSRHAVMWAQAGRDIPPYGTTHADTFYGPIPVTRQLTQSEVEEAYEDMTGKVIVEVFESRGIDPNAVPGVVVVGHGPFTWGASPNKAVENSIVLDEVAVMATETELINPDVKEIPNYLLDKHYFRKHGVNAYYGQG
jgi:L-ribulose-5-phosphate 4-epimerase